MKTITILNELKKFLTPVQVETLNILTYTKGKITIVLQIAEIVKTYNSTQENEDRVCELLSALCKNHFK